MKINSSNVTFSSIVSIGEKVKQASINEGVEYLALNRGVNDVVTIDLKKAITNIDYNTKQYQTYAPNEGVIELRKNIINEYFSLQTLNKYENITIMPGGMPGLDLIIQTLDVDVIYFPKFYWGSYSKMATIRSKSYKFYEDLSEINANENCCVFICDPNNPTGVKLDDQKLYNDIIKLSNTGATIVFDSPYRKMFTFESDFKMFNALSRIDNVIICESFSKHLGVSGSRLGFIWCNNKEFNAELAKRTLYEFNGVCTPSQLLVNELLTTCKKEVNEFRVVTRINIALNTQYLLENDLLATEIYKDYGGKPKGMFAIVKFTEYELFKHKIGAVGLDKFSYDKDKYSKFSRVCLSVPNNKFIKYFKPLC